MGAEDAEWPRLRIRGDTFAPDRRIGIGDLAQEQHDYFLLDFGGTGSVCHVIQKEFEADGRAFSRGNH